MGDYLDDLLRRRAVEREFEIVDERVYDTAILDLPELVGALTRLLIEAGEP